MSSHKCPFPPNLASHSTFFLWVPTVISWILPGILLLFFLVQATYFPGSSSYSTSSQFPPPSFLPVPPFPPGSHPLFSQVPFLEVSALFSHEFLPPFLHAYQPLISQFLPPFPLRFPTPFLWGFQPFSPRFWHPFLLGSHPLSSWTPLSFPWVSIPFSHGIPPPFPLSPPLFLPQLLPNPPVPVPHSPSSHPYHTGSPFPLFLSPFLDLVVQIPFLLKFLH